MNKPTEALTGTGPLLSLAEARDYLKVSRSTMDKILRAGELPTVYIGRRRLIHIDDLQAFVEKHRAPETT